MTDKEQQDQILGVIGGLVQAVYELTKAVKELTDQLKRTGGEPPNSLP
jgi:hypothetical protein